MFRVLGILLAAALIAGPAAAADVAVLVAARSYDDQPNARDVGDLGPLARTLGARGFDVETVENLRAGDLQERIGRLRSDMEAADRLVVVLAGHVASAARDSWLLARDAGRPDVFSVGGQGLPLGGILDIAATKPGAALIAVATSQRGVRLGDGLSAGYLPGEIPQGVSVLAGPATELLGFLEAEVLVPGRPLADAMEGAPDTVAAFGFVSASTPFLPAPPAEAGPDAADLALWADATKRNTADAYRDYLQRFPAGVHANEARDRLDALNRSPEALAAAEEEALALTRDQRREIQRSLSVLGHDPRGIDGIFGRGTRAAITAWQTASGFDATGYVTGNQVTQLQIQAERRARELEEEAKRRQEEQDRLDAEYWRDTGRGDTEAGVRAYLERYPDGLFSEVARERLDAYEAERRSEAEAAERDFWEDVRAADSPEAYRNYLENYPNGVFAEDARARLAEFEDAERSRSDVAAAEAEEARVLDNPIARMLVERRLQQLGLDPGQADGQFDDDTRRAIRRYQRSRDLEVTGYVDRATLSRMLAGGG